MWTIISDATNNYAQSKANTPEGNRFRDPTNPHYRTHCRLNKWTDITPSDLKIFIAHNIIMGLVKKSDLEKYWSTTKMTRLPFFGKYLSRNRFQSILWNLHICNDGENPPFQHHGHDPLAKLCPFISMVETNIMHLYKPEKNISIDEACCPFKGRLQFQVYNPTKPNHFHIKFFQISESSTGYILGFDIYTAHDETSVSKFSKPLDPETTKTTQIVMGLLKKFKLLDKGHNLYMDNYYSSPELFEELYYRQTYACGTTHSIRKGMPSMISKMDVKPLQSLFVQNGPLLCLKWKGAKTKTKKYQLQF